jgi:hypothetical protein
LLKIEVRLASTSGPVLLRPLLGDSTLAPSARVVQSAAVSAAVVVSVLSAALDVNVHLVLPVVAHPRAAEAIAHPERMIAASATTTVVTATAPGAPMPTETAR